MTSMTSMTGEQEREVGRSGLTVLLGDTDDDLLNGLAAGFHREGFRVTTTTDGRAALQRWQADQPDVVVLEVDLPGQSGLAVCRQIRESGPTPVILLSAQTTDDQAEHGFRVGADDYLEKPIRPRELAWRIRAVARRAVACRAVARRAAEAGAPSSRQEVRVDSLGLVLEPETHEVSRGSHRVHLAPLEFRLLCHLASNAGRVVLAQRLLESAWGYDTSETSLLKTHMTKIRKKLELPRQGSGSLTAVPGVGYRLQC